MKVLLNMYFDIRQNGALFEVYGDAGKCLTRKPTLAAVLDDIRAMAAGAELTDNIEVQLIDVLTPIEPGDKGYGNSSHLAELSRQRILDLLDEPDLLV